MYGTIQKWGNSSGIRIPKHILEAALLTANDRVEIQVIDENIVIWRARKPHMTAAERIESYYAAASENLPQSTMLETENWNTGLPVGEEEL